MKIAETSYDNSETGCCARFDPTTWDEVEVTWTEKLFLRDHVQSAFNIPLNYGSVMTRANEAIEQAGAYDADPICLNEHVSMWRSDVFLSLDRDVPGSTTGTLSGTYLTKVFEGPYRLAGTWEEEMVDYAASRGRQVERVYFYYTTCPRCAKRFGKNYVVLFAKVG